MDQWRFLEAPMRHSGLGNKVTRAWIVTDGIRLKNVTDLLRQYAAIEEYVVGIGLPLDIDVFSRPIP